MKDYERYFYYLWLSGITGIGSRTSYMLISVFESAENIWNASYSEIVSKGFSKTVAGLVTNNRSKDSTNAIIEKLSKEKIDCLCIDDEDYPEDLRYIYSPPVIIYLRGELPDNSIARISVIGTRRCTEYGANTGFSFAKELAEAGLIVVSGMAAGIDSAAHRGALAGGGKTIAVLGCGADVCYPPENKRLMDEIIANGCVVTEHPPGTRPLPGNFPARNRIISGLSKAVLVIEAGKRSGTLITVDHALEQGKDVFAVPGNITSSSSLGTNSLIQQGAEIVTTAQDLLNALSYLKRSSSAPASGVYADNKLAQLDEDEKNVYSYIGNEPSGIGFLSNQTGYSVPTLTYILTCLEIKNIVKKLPGNRYIKSL